MWPWCRLCIFFLRVKNKNFLYVYIYAYIYRFAWRCMCQKTTALYESISCNQYDPRSQYRCRATELSIQCSVVVFYTQPYMCVCVCVCVCIYIVFCVHKIEKNVVAEYCLPLIREGYGCFITSDSVQYSTISHPCIIEQDCNDAPCRTVSFVGRHSRRPKLVIVMCVSCWHPIKPEWERLASLCYSWKYHFYLSYKWYD